MALIEINDVRVQFPVYSARGRSLKHRLLRGVGGMISARADDHVVISALDGISLSLRSGDRVALIGGNGAGKSTLLRTLAGIVEPTSGSFRSEGRVSSLIDMSMGMDAEATGYENIVMRSVFLGATFTQARNLIPEIEAFSELGEYLAFPMRTYSTGMVLRLSFAIATAVQPEILVLDEMIGAGDAAFASKARARLRQIIDHLEIMVIATHSLETAVSMCNRGLVLREGKVTFDGPIEEAVARYAEKSPRPAPGADGDEAEVCEPSTPLPRQRAGIPSSRVGADWFSGKVLGSDWPASVYDDWLTILEPWRRREVAVLEIGTVDARAALLVVNYLECCEITCVGDFSVELEEVYFDLDVAEHGQRIVKYKERPIVALERLSSHDARFGVVFLNSRAAREDTLIEALMAWRLLAPGGVLIWSASSRGVERNSAGGSKAFAQFLELCGSQAAVLRRGAHIFVRRTDPGGASGGHAERGQTGGRMTLNSVSEK